ncbi:MAG TPA: hypothetical protein VIY29_30135 [Ktedonobacteraceae bacterium]
MTQSLGPLDPLLITIVLATLAIGLPILIVMSIRFLWDRNVHLGRSKELEKLIWQLHRIASAMEHQMNLSFPAVQPGTEEPHDLAFLQPPAAMQAVATPAVAAPANQQHSVQKPMQQPVQQHATPEPVAQQPTVPPPDPQQTPTEATPGRAGVNSMFGL